MAMIHLASDKSASRLSQYISSDVQPNAIDLRVEKIFKILPTDFVISETEKIHRKTEEIPLTLTNKWALNPGSYEVIMEGEITIGRGEAGWVIVRSTFNRNGVFLTSGLYDSGYSGKMAGVLHVTTGKMIIEKGTRIGQFLLFTSETVGLYNGSYGANSEHDKKYG